MVFISNVCNPALHLLLQQEDLTMLAVMQLPRIQPKCCILEGVIHLKLSISSVTNYRQDVPRYREETELIKFSPSWPIDTNSFFCAVFEGYSCSSLYFSTHLKVAGNKIIFRKR